MLCLLVSLIWGSTEPRLGGTTAGSARRRCNSRVSPADGRKYSRVAGCFRRWQGCVSEDVKLIGTDWTRVLHENMFLFCSLSESCVQLFSAPSLSAAVIGDSVYTVLCICTEFIRVKLELGEDTQDVWL